MNRKQFLKNCAGGVCSCAAAGWMGSLLTTSGAETNVAQEARSTKDKSGSSATALVPVDRRQIANTFSFLDSSMDEAVKKQAFERLGYEHLTDPRFRQAMEGWRSDLQGYFNRINSGKDTYWEKMEYIREPASVRITGKPATRCACPYAQTDHPAKALCNYCCKSFQRHLFEFVLQRPVRVELDEAFLLGGKRCSSTIFFEGKLDISPAAEA